MNALNWCMTMMFVPIVAAAMTPAVRGDDDAGAKSPGKMRVYIGTYTRGESQGIYVFEFDLEQGTASTPRLAAKSDNPSFLAFHPGGKFLYAVNETGSFGGEKTGAVSAFAIEKSGELRLLNQQPSKGGAPCHLVVSPRPPHHVLVANYTGGNVAALPVQRDGRLKAASGFVQHQGSSVNQRRQSGPHAHSINLDAAGRFAFATDLGLDQVLIYRFDGDNGTLRPAEPPAAKVAPGSGPRHFAFHPSGKFAYAINEMLNTVTAFAYEPRTGALKEVHTIGTLPEGFKKTSHTAEVQVHPSGRFLYGSNRGHDSLAIFAIDPSTGRLTAKGHQPTGGKTPRNFDIDPTGKYILAANQSSGNVVVFRVDQKTGQLRPTGVEIKVPSPVCVKFLKFP